MPGEILMAQGSLALVNAAGHCLSLLNKEYIPIKVTVISVFIVASSLS